MDKGKLHKSDLEKISQVTTSRELISLFVTKGALSRTLTYAELSRRAGFRARSFPREVVQGERSVNLKNVDQFADGLRLNRDLKLFLTTLVQLEQKNPPEKIQKLHENLAKSRQKILHARQMIDPQIARQKLPTNLDRWVTETSFAKVYAALGEPEKGATLEEIQNRTHLPLSEMGHALRILEKWEVVSFNESTHRYLPKHLHTLLSSHNSEDLFQACFKDAALRMLATFAKKTGSKQDLFFTSTFSVQKNSLPTFRQRLKDLLSEFIEESEAALGDEVVTLTTGLFRD